jgi:uncharacterized protein (DUF58 family)
MNDFFDPQVIGRVKGLELRSLRLVESLLVGMHKDASPSMFFKSDDAAMTKFEYAATVLASLAYLLMQQKDTFGLAVFDEKIRTHMPARSSGTHYRQILDLLGKVTSTGGKTDVGTAILNLAPQLKMRGLVIIVSDFVDNPERLGLGLGQLSFAEQDVLLLHVEDPCERDFQFSGQTIFLGSEGEGKLLCDPRDLRNSYLRARGNHLSTVRSFCMRFGFSLEDMTTDSRLDEMLTSLLSLRLARRKVR